MYLGSLSLSLFFTIYFTIYCTFFFLPSSFPFSSSLYFSPKQKNRPRTPNSPCNPLIKFSLLTLIFLIPCSLSNEWSPTFPYLALSAERTDKPTDGPTDRQIDRRTNTLFSTVVSVSLLVDTGRDRYGKGRVDKGKVTYYLGSSAEEIFIESTLG